jgi:hypothetical protein
VFESRQWERELVIMMLLSILMATLYPIRFLPDMLQCHATSSARVYRNAEEASTSRPRKFCLLVNALRAVLECIVTSDVVSTYLIKVPRARLTYSRV